MNKRRTRQYNKLCHICGKSFTSTRSDALYCSANCRKVAERNRGYIQEKVSRLVKEINELSEHLEGGEFRDPAYDGLVNILSRLSITLLQHTISVTTETSHIEDGDKGLSR